MSGKIKKIVKSFPLECEIIFKMLLWCARYGNRISSYKMQHVLTFILHRNVPKFIFWTVHRKICGNIFDRVWNCLQFVCWTSSLGYVFFKTSLTKVANSEILYLVRNSKLSRNFKKVAESFSLEHAIIFNFLLWWAQYDKGVASYKMQHERNLFWTTHGKFYDLVKYPWQHFW